MRNKGFKRSEIVRRMSEYWFGLIPGEEMADIYDDPGLFDEVQERMGELLGFLEHKGMLPPPRDANLKSSYGYARVYTWEDEDENLDD